MFDNKFIHFAYTCEASIPPPKSRKSSYMVKICETDKMTCPALDIKFLMQKFGKVVEFVAQLQEICKHLMLLKFSLPFRLSLLGT